MSTEGKIDTVADFEDDAGSLVEDVHENQLWAKTRWRQQLLRWGVEERGAYLARLGSPHKLTTLLAGILPVPPSQRTDRHYSKVFFVFFSANCNILSYVPPLHHLNITQWRSQVLRGYAGTHRLRAWAP